MAMVFQNYALYGHMTVYENMAFSLTLRNPDHTLTDKEADEIIQNVLKALETELGATLRA